MKKRIIIVLGILIAAGGIGTGVWYHFSAVLPHLQSIVLQVW